MTASAMKPHIRYRPTKTDDGQGGVTKVNGIGVTFYATVELWKNQPTMIVRRETDINVEDVIELRGANV